MRRLGLPLLLASLLVLTGCHHTTRPIAVAATTTTRPIGKCAAPASYLAKGHPDPCLTPGVVRSSDPKVICVAGYASKVRGELTSAQWTARRRQVEQRYGLTSNPGEIDHLLPLEGGGGNDLANLWPQVAPQYHTKDRAENALHASICAHGATLTQARALQAAFLHRWDGA